MTMEERKSELFRKALEAGVVSDPEWESRLDDPVPLWLVLELLLRLKAQLEPPASAPYD